MNKSIDRIIRSLLSKTPLYRLIDRYWMPYFRSNFKRIVPSTQIITPLTIKPENMTLDDCVRIQNHVNMISDKGQIVVKKFSSIGSGTVIIPGAHVPTVGLPQFFSYLHINDQERTITIEEDCWIGASCILLSKCHISRGAIVAAGSVVTKEVPPYAVVAGNPAKVIATRFSKEQIIKHEQILYPKEERKSEAELDELFRTIYHGLKSIGTCHLCLSDLEKLNTEMDKMHQKIYGSYNNDDDKI